MSDEQFDEIDPALEAALQLPDEQLIALDMLIEKLGGIEEAREVLQTLQALRPAA
jgi:thioredoxin-like negative regulator of GroEL